MKFKIPKGPPRYLNVIAAICRQEKWTPPECEKRLIPGRQFQCDFSWPEWHLVVEVQGGAFQGGRHSFGQGQVTDMEKLNELTLLGWRVLLVTPRQVTDGTLTTLLRRASGGYGDGQDRQAQQKG